MGTQRPESYKLKVESSLIVNESSCAPRYQVPRRRTLLLARATFFYSASHTATRFDTLPASAYSALFYTRPDFLFFLP